MVRLVDRSLVQYEPEEGRYRLLETLRQYGKDRLADAGETDETTEHHARFYLGLVERIAPELLDARYRIAHAQLSVELDNLRATAAWCSEHDRWVELAAMARQSWLFSCSAPVDGAAWYQQIIDHGGALDPQTVIDVLGELAYLQVAAFGDFTVGEASAQRSLALVETSRLEASPWAWLARATVAASLLTAGGGPDGLGPSELALAAADARHDEPAASVALNYRMIFVWTADPDQDSGAAAMRDALDRAQSTGNPLLITSAAFFAAGCPLAYSPEPDFAAGLDILTRYDDGIRVGGGTEVWLDVHWGNALLGLRQPGAVEHLTRAARLADRLSFLLPFDLALRLLAIAYAEARHASQAATLLGYADANTSQHRLDTPGLGWTKPRLERALAGLVDRLLREAEGSTWHRRQIMALINELLQRHRVTRANNRAPTVVTSKTLGRLKEADPDADPWIKARPTTPGRRHNRGQNPAPARPRQLLIGVPLGPPVLPTLGQRGAEYRPRAGVREYPRDRGHVRFGIWRRVDPGGGESAPRSDTGVDYDAALALP